MVIQIKQSARRQLITASFAVGTAAALPRFAQAQTWPARPVRVVVGFPAGGLTDALARAYNDYVGQKLGQTFVIENKPGASGMLAGAEVAKAAPDGYTFWFTITGTMNQNRVLYKKMPYDPDKDFAYVSGFDSGHLPLAVPSASPIKTMRDLVEMGKKQRITLGTYSAGSWPHMIAQQLQKLYGVQIDAVHYKGDAPMWVDLASGQITAAMGSYLAASPHLQAGKVRPIAVPTMRRSPLLPDVPTFVEQGFKEPVFLLDGWLGMFAPTGTPKEIIQRVSSLIQEAAESPRVKTLNKTYGLGDRPMTAEEFEKFDKDLKPNWINLARELGVSLD